MRRLLATVLMLWFGTMHAALVSHHGYTLDTETNIVTGGGLEWLQWDVTLGDSVNTALGNHAANGWRVATNTEMSTLLNAFPFGMVFDDIESTQQTISLASEGDKAAEFIALFGETQLSSPTNKRSQATYGTDLNANGYINHTYIEYWSSINRLFVADYRDAGPYVFFTVDTPLANGGVALVRLEGIPIPAALWLLGSGLGLLGWMRRKPA